MNRALRHAFAALPRPLRARWAVLIALTTLAGIGEIAAAAAVFRLISVVDRGGELARWALILAALFLGKNLVWAWAAAMRSALIASSMSAMFERTIAGFLAEPFAAHAQGSSADLTNRATYAVDVTCRLVLGSAAIVISEALVVAGVAAVLIARSPAAVLAALGFLALLTTLALALNHRIVARTSRESYTGQQEILRRVGEIFGGIAEIRAFGRERAFLVEGREAHERAMVAVRRQLTALSMPRLVVETLFVCSAALTLAVAARTAGPGIVPLLALYAYAGFRIVPAVNRIVYFVDEIRHGAFAVERLLERRPVARPAEPEIPPPPAAIALRGVVFGYGDAPVLRDVDLDVREGEWVAIGGETGSGKSTLVHVLAGLLDPDAGAVAIDRRRVALVPQHPFLLDDTLRRNVAFGLPADDERVREVLRIAALGAFSPDTIVGERGVRLSGGERQRIALARALYVRPAILLLDEATAALDWETEETIFTRLSELVPRLTIVAATHRRHSMGKFDRTLSMTGGRLQESSRQSLVVSR